MGKYVAANEVQAFLETKVSFGNSEDQVSEVELNLLIRQAESKVEMELSDQYVIPFQGYNNETFLQIPYETTTQVITNLCLYRSVYNVLKLFFGKTSNNRGESYLSFISDMYHDLLDPLKRKRNTGVFDIPPLTGLMLNGNSQRVSPVLPAPQVGLIGNSVNSFEYANKHVNDPRATLIWGTGRR
jgi:hypothetical protein